MSVLDARAPSDLLSLADWDALPEDSGVRGELVEGVVVVVPPSATRHQLVVPELRDVIDRALRPRWRALIEVAVVVDASATPTVRVPDVVVVDPVVVAQNRSRVTPLDVLAVVEVHSPSTRRRDRIAKVTDYAAAGIECYLLVEPGPPTELTELRLRDGTYELLAEHREGAVITLDGVDVNIDLAGLLAP